MSGALICIQNDSMRLLDRTEERPDIENKGLRKHFIETSHTHSASSFMVIYTYETHTHFITHRLSHTHTHLSNRQPCLGDPDFMDYSSSLFLRKKAHKVSSNTSLVGITWVFSSVTSNVVLNEIPGLSILKNEMITENCICVCIIYDKTRM